MYPIIVSYRIVSLPKLRDVQIYLLLDRLFLVFGYGDKAAMERFLWSYVIISLGYFPWSGIARTFVIIAILVGQSFNIVELI